MNSFTIYKDYIDLITLLPNRKEQSELLLAICNYMFFDEEPNLNNTQMKIFRNLKRPLDKSKKRGLSGSVTKSNENQIEIKSETHQDVYVNDNDNVKENKDIRGMGEEEKEETDTDDTSLLAEMSKKVISHLNEKTGSKYRANTKSTLKHINARLNDGYKLEDFIVVIDKKSKEWKETEFEKYLCPETLFGSKFEKYLNQKVLESKRKEITPDWFDKKFESKKPTPEEEAEINELLKSLGG